MRLLKWLRDKRIDWLEWRIMRVTVRKARFDKWFDWRIKSFEARIERIEGRGK